VLLATFGAGCGAARRGPDVLALMADAGRALADRKAAPLAEIVAPGVGDVRAVVDARHARAFAVLEHLGVGVGGKIGKRKANLRIDGVVDAAALAAEAGAGENLARSVVAEGLGDAGGPLDPRRLRGGAAMRRSADHAQRP